MRDRDRKIVVSRDAITVVDDAPRRGVRSRPVTRPGMAVENQEDEYTRVMAEQRGEDVDDVTDGG